MRCASCGGENSPTAKFCEECGTRLGRACPNCGLELGPRARFCPECGQAVAAAPGAAADTASPESYTPKYLAEKILASRRALEGERKQVTVLFADLKGSTELIQGLDVEDAQGLLDGAVKAMMEAVHRYEGTVNQILGDGVMALFGAPLAHEDHAVRACYAALAMHDRVRRYAEETLRRYGIAVQIRVGLNSGEVVVRAIANDLRMDYSAMGQTVHLAARMEQIAGDGRTLLTAETLRLAEDFIQVTPLGPVPVKGVADPVEVFELLGATATRTRLQASAARGLTLFVGRQAEMEALQRALALAAAGHGQIVAPVGEAGIGKSRLFWEFTHSHRTQGWLVLEAPSVSYGEATSYLPVIDLLKGYCRIEARDDARAIREKVTGKLLTLDESLRPTLPAFLALLDVPPEDPAWQALDPPQRRRRTLDAVKRLLLRESREQPLLLVFEDLHWIDSETQALLDSLVESLPACRVLLLVNYRPEYSHAWGSKTYYTQLRLDPLPAENAEELLRALLGGEAGLDPLRQRLIEQTEGNPFFLEESVRTLIETQVLVGERGAFRLAKALSNVEVPPTVQAVLAARIDRLPSEEKHLLQSAAVIGKDVPFALLQAIVDQPDRDFSAGLAHLQAAEFLYEASLFPELEYTFKHALTHDVTYRGLLQERRRTLHSRIVENIERLYPDRLSEHTERLAHHAVRGEMWEKAATYLRQAGTKAAARSAHREAVGYFEQALAALPHLQESRATREQAIDLRFDLRNVLLALGEFRKIFDSLREAETLAEALDDQRRLGRVCSYLIVHFTRAGDYDHAVEAGRRALAISQTLGDFSLELVANQYLGLAYYIRGEYRRAVELLRTSVESLQGDQIGDRFGQLVLPSVQSRVWLTCSHAQLGEFSDGRTKGEEGVRIAETVDHPSSRAAACVGLGVLYLIKGEFPSAIEVLERGARLCEISQLAVWFPEVASSLGSAYTQSGRAVHALPLLEQAVELTSSRGDMRGHSLRVANLGEGCLLAGRIDDALRLAQHAHDLSRNHKERGHEAYALRLLGEVAAHRAPPDVEIAENHYRQALTLAQELGMRPLVAHCHLGLGKLYRRVGLLEQARPELSAALEMFRSLEMTFWLPQAEAELAELTALTAANRTG